MRSDASSRTLSAAQSVSAALTWVCAATARTGHFTAVVSVVLQALLVSTEDEVMAVRCPSQWFCFFLYQFAVPFIE
jgi:hypothetical protein